MFQFHFLLKLEVCIIYTASKDTSTKNNLKSKTCCGSNHYFSLTSNFPFFPEYREALPCRKMGPSVLFIKHKQTWHISLPVHAPPQHFPFFRDLGSYILRMANLQDGRTSLNLDPQETARRGNIPHLLLTSPQPPHGLDLQYNVLKYSEVTTIISPVLAKTWASYNWKDLFVFKITINLKEMGPLYLPLPLLCVGS